MRKAKAASIANAKAKGKNVGNNKRRRVENEELLDSFNDLTS
jgi:hypothetical protein